MDTLPARVSRVRLRRSFVVAGTLLAIALVFPPAAAQQGVSAAGGAQSVVAGGAGAAANADFDSLIDLITSTVDRDSWMENGTGAGEIMEYANGVYVDAAGSLRMKPSAGAQPQLDRVDAAAKKRHADSAAAHRNDDARVASELRFVSLPRLEQAILQNSRDREPLDQSMLTLAGLRSVRYVAVNPQTHEILLAGPAGDWRAEQGALVAADTGSPLVRLDDLLTLWRRRAERGKTTFGCSIVPRQAALARTQEFLAQTSTRPLAAGGRGAWLAGHCRG